MGNIFDQFWRENGLNIYSLSVLWQLLQMNANALQYNISVWEVFPSLQSSAFFNSPLVSFKAHLAICLQYTFMYILYSSLSLLTNKFFAFWKYNGA